ncbi:MAG: DUF4143 domain-containing protein [Deltaproteobacteria bacterium]|nr:DUF4143 domain-containing protein [Deltaproteobacteria bacterium]
MARALSGRLPYAPTPEEEGALFETYLLHELRAYLSYSGLGYPLHDFRTHDDVEVDVVLETTKGFVALELKCTPEWRSRYSAGFRRLSAELPGVRCIGVFAGSRAQRTDGVEILPYGELLAALWEGAIIS